MRRLRRSREAGQTTLEVVLVFPIVLVLICLVIQFGLWYHATHVATAAAQEGVRAARLEGGNDSAGFTRANTFLDQLGSGIVLSRNVAVTRPDPDTVRIEVSGNSVSIVPGMSFALPVEGHAEAPIERFRGAQE